MNNRDMYANTTGYAPVGTVAMPKYEWLDAKTGRPLNKHERATAFIRDYMGRHDELPAIKVIMANAGVSAGTASRAAGPFQYIQGNRFHVVDIRKESEQ